MRLDATKTTQEKPSAQEASPKGPYYAQIPIELLSDKSVSPGAKCQYAAYHSFSKQKNLSKSCQTFASQRRVADFLRLGVRQVIRNQAELQKKGWIHVKKRGGTATNIITLFPKKQVPNHEDESKA